MKRERDHENSKEEMMEIEQESATDVKKIKTKLLDFSMLPDRELVDEVDVGITEFYNDTVPFTAQIKQRMEDFHVFEIDQKGNIAVIDYVEPVEAVREVEVHTNATLESLAELTSVKEAEEFKAFIESEDSEESAFRFEPTQDKIKRKKIHQWLKDFQWDFKLASNTSPKGEVVVKSLRRARATDFDDRNKKWQKSNPQFCKMIMYKMGLDTMTAVARLAKALHLSIKSISYAGSKDRRGVTSQWITIRRFDPERVKGANKALNKDGVFFGDGTLVRNRLELGHLGGNLFKIVLRDVEEIDPVKIENAARKISENGFINYFGMQRFGTGQIPSNDLGKAVLRKDFALFVRLLLAPRKNDYSFENIIQARMELSNSPNPDYKQLMRRFPHFLVAERSILKSLSNENGENDLENAFMKIPRNLRMMYLHAYQSMIWNRLVSKRMKEFPHQPIVGDLVMVEADGKEDKPKVKSLEENELDLYTIHDIVLPVPGCDVELPKNELAKTLNDYLAEDGFTLETFRHRNKSMMCFGTYRHILVKPKFAEWELLRYNDPLIPLIQHEKDRIRKLPPPTGVPDGEKLALKISFGLPVSSYATMFFRELTKQSSRYIR